MLTFFAIYEFDAIITFGGSPTGVRAPPIFEKIIIAIRIGTGLSSITSHNLKRFVENIKINFQNKNKYKSYLMLTGVISRTVVTLSKNDDITAVNTHKQLMRGHTLPFVIFKENIYN